MELFKEIEKEIIKANPKEFENPTPESIHKFGREVGDLLLEGNQLPLIFSYKIALSFCILGKWKLVVSAMPLKFKDRVFICFSDGKSKPYPYLSKELGLMSIPEFLADGERVKEWLKGILRTRIPEDIIERAMANFEVEDVF